VYKDAEAQQKSSRKQERPGILGIY